MATYDWLQTYSAARGGAYGDRSQDIINQITKDNPDVQKLIDSGVIKPETATHTVTSPDSGVDVQMFTPVADAVDISRLPAMGPAGYTPPKGYGFDQISGNYRQTDGNGNTTNDYIGFYDDPNYGKLGLRAINSQPDFVDRYVGPLILAFASGATAGPLASYLGGAADIGAFGTSAIKTGLSTAISSGVSGHAPNPFSVVANLLKPGLHGLNFSSLFSSGETL